MRLGWWRAILACALSSLFMVLESASAEEDSVDIWIWDYDGIEKNFVILEKHHDGPCGTVARIQLAQLPAPLAAARMGFELVVEYRQDIVVGRWATPANLLVSAVEGDFIYVDEGERSLKIGRDGSIMTAPRIAAANVDKIRDCPPSVEAEIPNSAFLRCFAFDDLKSGESRTLGFQGPCT